jgi:ribonuclease HII
VKDPDLSLERAAWDANHRRVAGIDEAGRGAWAGPVVAAAVILPADRPDLPLRLVGVRDSKLCTPRQRERLYEIVQSEAVSIGVGVAGLDLITAEGIAPAVRQAMGEAIGALHPRPDYLLIDYIRLPEIPLPQRAITRGDQISLSIAAASIIAKVARDRLMVELGDRYPVYGFARHKGYGTREHQEAIAVHGPTPFHRQTWAPFVGVDGD